MANFTEHITQAKHNLEVLHQTNKFLNSRAWDWQVTMCFYTAVHLINGHIAQKQNLHYKSHNDVKNSINPCKSIRIGTELTEDLYKSYVKIQNLSRRSRYLCKDEEHVSSDDEGCYITFDKHLKKAIHHLDKLMFYISTEYNIDFPKLSIDCIEIKGNSYSYFNYLQHII